MGGEAVSNEPSLDMADKARIHPFAVAPMKE